MAPSQSPPGQIRGRRARLHEEFVPPQLAVCHFQPCGVDLLAQVSAVRSAVSEVGSESVDVAKEFVEIRNDRAVDD